MKNFNYVDGRRKRTKKEIFLLFAKQNFFIKLQSNKKFVVNILKELFQAKFWKSSFKFCFITCL